MARKTLTGLLLLCLLAGLWMGLAQAAETNLLTNGGFETVTASGRPDGWYTSAYRTQEGFTRFEITDEKAHSGRYSARITNANLNDARYVHSLAVKPESMYRVSGYILVESMEHSGNGANLSVEGVYAFSVPLYNTDGEWKYVEWYGETGEGQTEIELDVRVGGYSAESQGIAYFDDIAVAEVDTLPAGVIASIWYTVDTGDAAADEGEESAAEAAAPQKDMALLLLLAAAFLLLSWLGIRMMPGNHQISKRDERLTLAVFGFLLLGALLLRVLLGGRVSGYQVDMNCFAAWSLRMADQGPWGFYSPDVFCDYPPGYMLLLWPVGLLIKAVGYSDTAGVRLLIKAIPILCDMSVAVALFACAKKRVPLKAAAFVALLFALNPAAIVNGAAWGQVDTVLALLMLLTAVTAMNNDWRKALPLFIIGVLVKPQALLFAPAGGLWMLLALSRGTKADRRRQWRHIWQGSLIALGCAAAIIVPFAVRQSNPFWLLKLYGQTLSSYNYASLNTANLMYLLGGNWSPLSGINGYGVVTLPWPVPAATGALLLCLGALGLKLYRGPGAARRGWKELLESRHALKGFGDEGRRMLLSLLLGLMGLVFLTLSLFRCTFMVYGTAWMAFSYLYAMLMLVADGRADALPFAMALMLLGVYVTGVKIHERYLFAALALLPLGYIRTGDRRLLWLCAGLSATTFLNTAIVLENSILLGSSMGHLNADTVVLNDLLCVVNLLLYGFAGYIAYTGPAASPAPAPRRAREPRTAAAYRSALLTPADARLRMTARDYWIMAVTVVLYAGLTFTNLGSAKAPQTAWVATSASEQVVFELPRKETFKLLYYAGVSYNNFSVSVSDDGETWSEPYACEMSQGLCYRWNYAVTSTEQGEGSVRFDDDAPGNILRLTGKYLRVNAEAAGLNLWEILLRDPDGAAIPLRLVAHTGARDVLETERPPENLIDEQDTLEGEPSWFNGTYFDEIYHARTAYEHLHGLAPYETTHPPLGKLIMSVGIAIFGMTPFGWRFMGALTGVAMLPALYLLARQLTKRRDLATFSMLLFSLDLMHFTQTRIATIDSFPVLFILLATLCMVRYLQTDAFAVPDAPEAKEPRTGKLASLRSFLPRLASPLLGNLRRRSQKSETAPADQPRVWTRPFWRTLLPLMLCGFFMGLSIASKWIGLYSAAGLAVMFLLAVYRQFRAGMVAFDVELDQALTKGQQTRVLWARSLTLRRILATCLMCVIFFIAVPALIYYLSYIPYLSPTGPVTLERLIDAQEGMFAYQSTPGLGMDHPFYSPWWQWPLILKPMWFCQDKFEPAGFASTIMCMGNPLIYYVGALCMAAVFALFIHKYVRFRGGLRLREGDGNLTVALVGLGFLTQYLPWVLVPRSMYMYHYFASVPFIILATALVFNLLPQGKLRKWAMIVYVALAAAFFAMFYPYASGLLTPTSWLDWLKWFPRIYY